MFNNSLISKSLLGTATLSLALFSATAFAGPGKSGENGKPAGVGQPGESNIVEIAMSVNEATGQFSYLLGAVGCFTDEDSGENPIVDLLNGSDKLTLFAPTDDAFIALQGVLGVPEEDRAPEVTCLVDSVLETPGALFTILAYHLTDGRRFSNSLFNENSSKEVEMLAGGNITTSNGTIIDGFPQVINGVEGFLNINASNGVIHVIDTVMLPYNPLATED